MTRLETLEHALDEARKAEKHLRRINGLVGSCFMRANIIHTGHGLDVLVRELALSVEYEKLKSDPNRWSLVPCLEINAIVYGTPIYAGSRWALIKRSFQSSRPAKHAIVYRHTGAQSVLDSREAQRRLVEFVERLERAPCRETAFDLLRAWHKGVRQWDD